MPNKTNFRYLPVLPDQRKWGLFMTDCGYTVIEPDTPYPPQRHPDAYQFDWQKGRTLDEYQVVYITRGQGVFETKGQRRQNIKAGDVFLLFPGVWHRYAPDPRTGWDEQWIGFNGPLSERFMRAPFFKARQPLLHVGVVEILKKRFIALVDRIVRDPAGAPFSNAGEIIAMLGLIHELVQQIGSQTRLSSIIREAQNIILMRFKESIDFNRLASSLGLGYTTFRHRFKQQTGVSPLQFQNSIRLNHAQDLLLSTDLSVSEIAQCTGFDTVYYFSRVFTKKTGISAKAFREHARLRH